jgi:hypothetical protein
VHLQLQHQRYKRALHQSRDKPVDVQIGFTVFLDVPQEMRSRLWLVLLQDPALAVPLRELGRFPDLGSYDPGPLPPIKAPPPTSKMIHPGGECSAASRGAVECLTATAAAALVFAGTDNDAAKTLPDAEASVATRTDAGADSSEAGGAAPVSEAKAAAVAAAEGCAGSDGLGPVVMSVNQTPRHLPESNLVDIDDEVSEHAPSVSGIESPTGAGEDIIRGGEVVDGDGSATPTAGVLSPTCALLLVPAAHARRLTDLIAAMTRAAIVACAWLS